MLSGVYLNECYLYQAVYDVKQKWKYCDPMIRMMTFIIADTFINKRMMILLLYSVELEPTAGWLIGFPFLQVFLARVSYHQGLFA